MSSEPLALSINEQIPMQRRQDSAAIDGSHSYWKLTMTIRREDSQNKLSERHDMTLGIWSSEAHDFQPSKSVSRRGMIKHHTWHVPVPLLRVYTYSMSLEGAKRAPEGNTETRQLPMGASLSQTPFRANVRDAIFEAPFGLANGSTFLRLWLTDGQFVGNIYRFPR